MREVDEKAQGASNEAKLLSCAAVLKAGVQTAELKHKTLSVKGAPLLYRTRAPLRSLSCLSCVASLLCISFVAARLLFWCAAYQVKIPCAAEGSWAAVTRSEASRSGALEEAGVVQGDAGHVLPSGRQGSAGVLDVR